MNIFYLSEDPVAAAKYQYNKHVVKMILESAQLLSTCHREFGDEREILYKKTHTNHPSAVWVRESSKHYHWLWQHMMALGDEYTARYGKTHLTISKLGRILFSPPNELRDNGFVPPPQCMPEAYHDESTVEAYRNYYADAKGYLACSNYEPPEWWLSRKS